MQNHPNKYVSLARNAAFNMMYKLLNVLFPLVSIAYVSRVLGPEGVGKVSYAQNVVSYFVMLAVLGIPRYGTREIARNRNDASQINKLFSELFLINTISTMIFAAAFYYIAWRGLFENWLLYVVCGTEILFNLINIDWLYEGEEEYVYITLRSILIKAISLCLMFVFVKEPGDYLGYALIHSLGICGNNLFNVIHAKKRVRFTLKGLRFGRHLKPILILAVSAIASGLYNKLNVTILGYFQPDSVVGYYTNAYKMVSVAVTLVTALSAVFMPRLSYLFQHEPSKVSQLTSRGVEIILLLAIPGCAGIILVAPELTGVVFGEMFLASVPAIQIMAVLIIIVGLGDLLCYQIIISTGQESRLINSRLVAGAVNVIMNLILIPRFRHIGAAVATVVSELIVNGMLLPYALSVAKPSISRRFVLSVVLGTAAMALAVVFIQQIVNDGIVALALTVVTGIACYFAVLVILKNELVFLAMEMLKQRIGQKR